MENIEKINTEIKTEEEKNFTIEETVGSKTIYTHEKHGTYDRGTTKIFQKRTHYAPGKIKIFI